jgi:tetratricopeptide (TPR) repeat protein
MLVLAAVLWRKAGSLAVRGAHMALGFGLLWMLITLSPVSNLLFLSGILLAERTLYLPSVGFAIALAWMVGAAASERRRVVTVAMVAALALLGVRTVTRVPVWSSQLALFSDLVEDFPQSARAQWFVGDILAERGDLRAARVHWKYAIGLSNRDFPVVALIAEKMARYGDPETAGILLRRLEEDWPGHRAAMEFAAMTYANLGWQDEAIRAGRLALKEGGQKAVIYSLVANAYAQQGDFEEALGYRSRALDVAGRRERWALWYAIATDFEAMGRVQEAQAALDSSRVHRPPPPMVPRLDSLEALLIEPSGGL